VKALKLAALSTLCWSAFPAEDAPAPTGETIVDPSARFELLYTRPETEAGGLTESPAVAPDGSIYFSDILRGENLGHIQRCDPA